MSLLTKDQILGADDIVREKVEVPEWNGHVFVQSMTGTQRDSYEVALFQSSGSESTIIRARVVAYCAVDDKGNRLFAEEDLAKLSGKSAKALTRIYLAARRVSGLDQESVEEAEKN